MRTTLGARSGAMVLAVLLTGLPLLGQGKKAQPVHLVEVRSYNLKPGTRGRFHQLFLAQALPMLHRWRVDVVAYGPSLHDNDSYFLMRAYPGLEDRQRSEDAFYGSDEWKKGPREAILADIESYTTLVLPLDDAAIQGLRTLNAQKAVGHGR